MVDKKLILERLADQGGWYALLTLSWYVADSQGLSYLAKRVQTTEGRANFVMLRNIPGFTALQVPEDENQPLTLGSYYSLQKEPLSWYYETLFELGFIEYAMRLKELLK